MSLTDSQPSPTTFFLDRGIGRKHVAVAMRAAGATVELHDDHFAHDAEDSHWLVEVGKRGWVVVTKDRHMKCNQIEIAAIISAQVACFNIISAQMTGPDMAVAMASALPGILRLLPKIERPFVANVTKYGGIDILFRYRDLVTRLDEAARVEASRKARHRRRP